MTHDRRHIFIRIFLNEPLARTAAVDVSISHDFTQRQTGFIGIAVLDLRRTRDPPLMASPLEAPIEQ